MKESHFSVISVTSVAESLQYFKSASEGVSVRSKRSDDDMISRDLPKTSRTALRSSYSRKTDSRPIVRPIDEQSMFTKNSASGTSASPTDWRHRTDRIRRQRRLPVNVIFVDRGCRRKLPSKFFLTGGAVEICPVNSC